MKNKSLSPMGSMHPVLFLAVVYAVVLFFSIFICSSLFYSCNASPGNQMAGKQNNQVLAQTGTASMTTQ